MQTDTETLQQAINCAEAQGWDNQMQFYAMDVSGVALLVSRIRPSHYVSDPVELLFNHAFMKAIFGNGPDYELNGHPRIGVMPLYKWHMMNLSVLEDEERLAYLGKHL